MIDANDSVALQRERRKVIFGSALGSAFEWYEFFIYGILAPIIAAKFFTGVSESVGFIFALLTFGIGFAARPFGSLVFGRLGDLVGRKYTFLMTMLAMAVPTFLIGLLPSYASIGVAAPIILIALRIVQGLSLGGEFGGAMVYVYEHSPQGRRGRDTSWIPAMGVTGVILAVSVQLIVRNAAGPAAFAEWGWRIPFLLSAVLFGITLWVRMNLNESPVFAEMKAQGKTSKSPIKDAFGNGRVVWTAILLVFGLTAGLGVIAYTAMFYSQFFMTRTLKIDSTTVSYIILVALLISIPFYPLFGWLSDKLGRKPILVAGLLVSAVTVMPTFKAMTAYGNPELQVAQQSTPVSVFANPDDCALQFNPVNTSTFTSSCDIAKSHLANQMVNYTNEPLGAGQVAHVKVGDKQIASIDGSKLSAGDLKQREKAFQAEVNAALVASKYPTSANPNSINHGALVALTAWLLILYAWVFGSIPTWMCETFASRIRYTAMSLPYNLGTGLFGGFMPATAFAMVAANGNIYFGLWYTIIVLLIGVPVSLFMLPESHGRTLEEEDDSLRLVRK